MDFESQFLNSLKALEEEGRLRSLEKPSGVSFIHNDYLDLARHPEILTSGEEALRLFGGGSRGSRLLGGHSRIFEEVEDQIAQFFGAPSSLLFSTGYLANQGVVTAVSEFIDEIHSDEKNHASLIDGIRLSGKPKKILPHNQWPTNESQKVLSISESLFSMDGTCLDWESFKKREGFLIVDEAHAAGVFREEGKGFILRDEIPWQRMAVVVTFGKAFGVAGAAVLGAKWLKDWLINRARQFIYTTGPSPCVVSMIGAALKVVEKEKWRREELWDRSEEVRNVLSKNFEQTLQTSWEKRSPIIPIRIPGDKRVVEVCKTMRRAGFDLRAIRYPTVPEGEERIRISLNLGVSRDNTLEMAKHLAQTFPFK